MHKYLSRDARLVVGRKELLEALDKADDMVEVEFEPLGLASVDKVRVGSTILTGKPDISSHKIARFKNFKEDVEFLGGEEIILAYSKDLGVLELIGDNGRHHITVKEIKPPVIRDPAYYEDSWC